VAVVGVHRPYRAACACRRGECLQAEAPHRALAHYERAVALAPEQDVYWVKLAAAAQVAAQAAPTPPEREALLRRALRALEHATALVPANPAHHANLGRLLSQMAAVGLAPPGRVLAAFEDALALDPNNPCVLADAAQAALSMRRWDEADAYLGRGLALDPGCALFWAGRGRRAVAGRRPDEAARYLVEALRADWRGDEEAYWEAAELLSVVRLGQGQYEGARSLADAVVGRHPDWPRPRFTLARALEALGRPDAARAEYRCLVEHDPGHGAARLALRRLEGRSH
jgi:tetratricopeptide (TPR) repeat protein